MKDKNEWETFFNGHAPVYMDNSFTKNTLAEVDFLLDELKLPPGSRILDIGCGTGRHSVELAKRGFKVTGVDISPQMLAEAEKAAAQAGVKINWINRDAAVFKSKEKFDAAICLCEGAFGLLGAGDDPIEHDLSILRNIHSSLKPKARLIMTLLNGLFKIRHYDPKAAGDIQIDPTTLIETFTLEYDTPEGKKNIRLKERGYVPTELALLFRLAGFGLDQIWGGTAGNWGHRPVKIDEMEIMAVAHKKPAQAEKNEILHHLFGL
jgi:2-polyprenyl-3-methyl-5-hydroxy-6-metoxy-1,4-benzoquinol methylase